MTNPRKNETRRRITQFIGREILRNKDKIVLICNEKGRKAYVDIKVTTSSMLNPKYYVPGKGFYFRISVEYLIKNNQKIDESSIEERIIFWMPYPGLNIIRGYTYEEIQKRHPYVRFTTIKWFKALELLKSIARYPSP